MKHEKHIEEKRSFAHTLSTIMVKIRIPLLATVAVLIICAVGAGIFVSLRESSYKKGFAQLDSYTFAFTEAKKKLTGDQLTTKEDELLVSIEELAKKYAKNPVGSRAYMAAADIHFDKKNWEAARTAWLHAAQANPKAYTAPLCFYNAAVASEELNDFTAAADYYSKASAAESFALISHALFSLARVEDEQGNIEKAKTHYTDLVSKYPSDSWAALAKTRLIALETTRTIE